MLYKPDLDEMIPRVEAWWHGRILDRCCLAVTAPNGKPRREVAEPDTAFERRADMEYLVESAEAHMEATYYAGEAIPVFRPDLGADVFAACLGAPLEYTEHTTWAKETIAEWGEAPSFEIDESSFAWKWHHDVYHMAAERAAGRYFVAAPDCHSGGDALLAMRGGSKLCLDLYDSPDAVRAAMAVLEKSVAAWHGAWWPLIEASGQRGHTCSWLDTWSPGRSNVIQLDLLAFISPAQFTEFFLHELELQINLLDQTVFHLDGPECIPHLPILHDLLGHMPDRSGDETRKSVIPIQWVHGAGHAPMVRWIPFLRDLQAQGANLHLWCEAREVETLVRQLSSRGLFLCTSAGSVEEADRLVKLAEALAHD